MKKKFLVSILCLFAYIASNASNDHEPPIFTQNNNLPSLSTILNEDGTVNLTSSVSGSFNPSGFEMISKPGEAPRFAPVTPPSMNIVGDEYWDNPFASASINSMFATVRAVLLYGGTLYIGGNFTNVDNNPNANYIARWIGNKWVEMGTGGMNNQVCALAVDGSNNIYAGGYFTTAGGVSASHIARWSISTSTWYAMGTGASGNVWSIATSGTNIYITGGFTTAGGITVNNVAKWNGTAWSALGTSINNNGWGIVTSGANVYVGGSFTTAGGVSANRVAMYNGTTWSALGTGLNNSVSAIAVSGANIYVGGSFTTAGGLSANRVAMWNGITWSALGTGADNTVLSIAVSGTNVYIGGMFLNAGGVSASRIAMWNGTTWAQVGSGLNNNVNTVFVSGTDVYAGGDFVDAGGDPLADYLTEWSSGIWHSFPSGVSDVVYAIAVEGQNLYIGGNFTNVGGVPNTSYIAKWNGASWIALGTGLSGFVMAIETVGTNVYVGGSFTNAGGNAMADYIARWDGTMWNPLGSGTDSWVHCIEKAGTDIYVGGEFTLAGGVTNTSHVAKWNGTSWSALGTGLNAQINALNYCNNILYAGGLFSNAGGDPNADFLAKWNGSAWSAVGNVPLTLGLNAIENDGNNIYIGGAFLDAGGIPAADYVAKWNGTSWQALGTSVNNTVYTLLSINNDLYVGGVFTSAGGNANCKNVARWDGSNWNNLGVGTNASLRSFASDSNYIYVGGNYTIVGGKSIRNLARYGVIPKITSHPIAQTACVGDSKTFTIHTSGSPVKSCQWKFNGVDIPGQTDSVLVISPVSLLDQGNYSCRVNNYGGSVTSNNAYLTVHSLPIADIGNDTSFCVGNNVYLQTTQVFNGYLWSTGAVTAGITVSTAGNYYVVVTDLNGCSNTSNTIYVTQNPLPNVTVSSPQSNICLHSSTTLNAFGANTFTWSPATGLSATAGSSVTANPLTTTTYTITGTSLANCTNTATITINVYEPFNNEQICIVTVDTALHKNKIVWEKTANVRTTFYKILKESTFTGVYDSIGILPYDSMSVFVDTSSHPDQVQARYKIMLIDSCGNESDSSIAHQTIHLAVSLGVPSGHQLSWNAYQGNFSFGTYYIYAGTSPSNLVKIDSVASTVFSKTYPSPPPGQKYYCVSVQKADTCYASSVFKDQTQTSNTSVSNMEEYQIIGIDENQNNLFGLNVYPNPSSETISVSATIRKADSFEILFTDILGKKLFGFSEKNYSGQFNKTFDIKEFASGVYFITLTVDRQSKLIKVIKY